MAPQQSKTVKAGNSRDAASHRRKLFVHAYLTNGHNATQAAIAAGYSKRSAYSLGQRLLKHVEVSEELAAEAEKAARASGLDVERSLQETARIAFADPRRLFNSDGSLKTIAEWDDDIAAAVASIDVQTCSKGSRVTKIKFWDKNAAIEKAMKHLGLFEKDNKQRIPVEVTVTLVGGSYERSRHPMAPSPAMIGSVETPGAERDVPVRGFEEPTGLPSGYHPPNRGWRNVP